MPIKENKVQIDFPQPPKVVREGATDTRQQEFDRWYYDLRTSLIREFERLTDLIDQKQNKT